jgi:hypothetical protein
MNRIIYFYGLGKLGRARLAGMVFHCLLEPSQRPQSAELLTWI